jgi:hypothetical protein
MTLSKVYSNEKALADLNNVFKLTKVTKDQIARDGFTVDIRIVYDILVAHLTTTRTYATPGCWPVNDCFGNPLKTDFGRICAAITLARHHVQDALGIQFQCTHTRYGKDSVIYKKHQALSLIAPEYEDSLRAAMELVMRKLKKI